jgi:hypothetical protein
MQKKSLGRGLEDISNIFISQKKESLPANDSISEDSRMVVDGSIPEDTNEASEINLPTQENEDIIAAMDRQNADSNNSNTEPSYQFDHPRSDDAQRAGNHENVLKDRSNSCQITEHITINKNIAYSNTPDVQQNIVKSLFQYLGQNYEINKVELTKVNQISKSGTTRIIDENILIYRKDGAKSGG